MLLAFLFILLNVLFEVADAFFYLFANSFVNLFLYGLLDIAPKIFKGNFAQAVPLFLRRGSVPML